MAYPTLDYRQVRDVILRDIANKLPAANVGSDSDYYVRANATGSAIEGLYEHQKWIARQLFADTADIDILESKHANPRGITRKVAARAAGSVSFNGTVGAAISIGTEVKTGSGISFITTAAGVIGAGGTAIIAAQASVAGISGNQVVGAALMLSAAPSGVQSNAAIVSMTGGADIETPAALLARVLFDIRMPESGGASYDYYKWALEVPGVTDAYIFTQRRVANGVDVVIETSGGLAGAALIAAVAAYIETKRPPGANVLVGAPTLVNVPITAVLTLNGAVLADVQLLASAALTNYFNQLHVGDVVRRAQLITLLTSIKGVIDVNLNAPAANVQPVADATHSELAVLGVVTLS